MNEQSRLDVRKYSIFQMTINVWNKVSTDCVHASTVVLATAGTLGERPPALAGHFCNVPTTVFAVLMSLYPAATFHDGPPSLRTGGGRSWQVLL